MTQLLPSASSAAATRAARRITVGLAIVLTGYLLALHLASLLAMSPLWRDEINSVNLASMPMASIIGRMQFDSFPVLWFAFLRTCVWLGMGNHDAYLRVLGFLIGVTLLAVLWIDARRRGPTAVLLLLSLVALQPAVLLYGDTIRAYGLGLILAVAVIAAFRRTATSPSRSAFLIAGIISLLAVHMLYYNAIVILAAATGAAAAAFARKQRLLPLIILALPAPAALSLAVYAPVWLSQAVWIDILRWDLDVTDLIVRFWKALHVAGTPFAMVYASVVIGLVVYALPWNRRDRAILKDPRYIFSSVLLGVGVLGHFTFLRLLRYLTKPWYYLTLVLMIAFAVEGMLTALSRRRAWIAANVAAAALVVTTAATLPSLATQRRTNVDQVATWVAASLRPRDLVIVSPWMYGITFQRYLAGDVPWTTVPPIADHSAHRYDLLRAAMMDPHAMDAVAARVRRVLQRGGRIVWVATHLEVPEPNERVDLLPPAPSAPWGWAELPHYRGWNRQVTALFAGADITIVPAPVHLAQHVSRYGRVGAWIIERRTGSPPAR